MDWITEMRKATTRIKPINVATISAKEFLATVGPTFQEYQKIEFLLFSKQEIKKLKKGYHGIQKIFTALKLKIDKLESESNQCRFTAVAGAFSDAAINFQQIFISLKQDLQTFSNSVMLLENFYKQLANDPLLKPILKKAMVSSRKNDLILSNYFSKLSDLLGGTSNLLEALKRFPVFTPSSLPRSHNKDSIRMRISRHNSNYSKRKATK